MTSRVAILGPGRAGRAIAGALRAAGVDVVGLVGRGGSVAAAEVILVAVRDGDLPAALANLGELAPGVIVLHTSGGTDPAAALESIRAAGHPAGTFHPLVPLADPDAGARQLRGAWIGVDGDPAAVAVAEQLATALGAHVLRIPRGAKPGYHAAAVIAANFLVVLAAAAERTMRRAGVEPAAARAAVAHLMQKSVEHVVTLGPERALTGPVSRGDAITVARNLAALTDDPAVHDLYAQATRIAVELARVTGTASEDNLDAIQGAVDAELHS